MYAVLWEMETAELMLPQQRTQLTVEDRKYGALDPRDGLTYFGPIDEEIQLNVIKCHSL